jgi:hypothetical protein
LDNLGGSSQIASLFRCGVLEVNFCARPRFTDTYRLCRDPVLDTKKQQPKKIPQLALGVFSLVDLARENWNCTFEDLVTLCERLEELDIEARLEADFVCDSPN